jgi:Spy/CpxP family protein refolding chaperone
MKQLMIAVMLSIGIGSVAMSVGGEHGQRLAWDQLDLTDQQALQVQAIRKTYREDFQRMRKYDIEAPDKKRQLLVLRDAMVANIEQVLSAQQKAQAGIMMVEQAEKRISQRLNLLAGKLDLTSKQQVTMRSLVSTNLVHNPRRDIAGSMTLINHSQYMIDQIDQFMPNILSSVQLVEWQKIKNKHREYLAS